MWNFEWRALGAASLLGIGLALLMSCSVAERAAGALSAIQRANRLRAQETVSFRFLEPLVHASGELGKALRRLMIGQKRGETFFAHLERKLLVAGDPGGLSAEELLGVALFASLGTTALAGWLLPEEFPIRRATIGLVGFGALAAPYFRLGALREEREREVRRTLPRI